MTSQSYSGLERSILVCLLFSLKARLMIGSIAYVENRFSVRGAILRSSATLLRESSQLIDFVADPPRPLLIIKYEI